LTYLKNVMINLRTVSRVPGKVPDSYLSKNARDHIGL